MYFFILTLVGDSASIISGILAAKKLTNNRFIWLVSALLNTFGGNILLRILATRGIESTIFISSYELKLMVAFAIIMIIINQLVEKHISPNYNIATTIPVSFKSLLLVGDALGTLTSIAVSYEQGIQIEAPQVITVFCGWVGVVGGRILFKIVISTQMFKTFNEQMIWLKSEVSKNTPEYFVHLVTTVTYGQVAMAIGSIHAIIALMPFIVLAYVLNNKELKPKNRL